MFDSQGSEGAKFERRTVKFLLFLSLLVHGALFWTDPRTWFRSPIPLPAEEWALQTELLAEGPSGVSAPKKEAVPPPPPPFPPKPEEKLGNPALLPQLP